MRILLGVTGGVAAFKSLEVLRGLVKSGHDVTAVLTQNALRFVGRTSFEALSGNPSYSDLFEDASEVPHVRLAKTDLILVVPATASFIARYANGIADDLLLNVLLASTAKVVIAPAMHTEMWQHPATVQNLETLKSRGVLIIEPEFGALTSGDVGQGRLAAVERIIETALGHVSETEVKGTAQESSWAVITAGGTREPIDDVRFLGNFSSGMQGVELARALVDSGWRVTLVGANIPNPQLPGVEFVAVRTHADLEAAISPLNPDLLLMAAAVSDFSTEPSRGKIKRNQQLELRLSPTSDIVAGFVKTHPATRTIAFAAEAARAGELLEAGLEKLRRKGVLAVIANNLDAIGSARNDGYVITAEGSRHFSGSKAECAHQIIKALEELNVIA